MSGVGTEPTWRGSLVVFLVAAGLVAAILAVSGGFVDVLPAVLGAGMWASIAAWWYRAGRRPVRQAIEVGGRPRSMIEVWGPRVVIVLFASAFLWSGVIPRIRSLGSDGAVLAWNIDIDSMEPGSALDAQLAGDLEVPETLQIVAMCRNGTEWLSDTTLNTDVVVGTTPTLVRAAELVSDGTVEGDLAHRIERRAWAGDSDDEIVAALGGDDRAPDVERYLAARRQPPSAAAVERFVAYAAVVDTFGNGLLFVVDRNALDRGAIGAFAAELVGGRMRLAGSGESREVRAGACRDVVDG